MSNCDRLSDDAAFVDCLTLAPFDAWTARDALRLLTIAVRATHLPAQRYVSSASEEAITPEQANRRIDELHEEIKRMAWIRDGRPRLSTCEVEQEPK
jgi:hypothetical protein